MFVGVYLIILVVVATIFTINAALTKRTRPTDSTRPVRYIPVQTVSRPTRCVPVQTVTSPADHIRLIEQHEAEQRKVAEQREAQLSALIAQRQDEKQRKAQEQRNQAEADEAFLIDQIDKMYSMLWDADAELEQAQKTCQHDDEMNQAGAVVAVKVVNKHRAERDKLTKRVMQLERSIHAYETKLNKARYILTV